MFSETDIINMLEYFIDSIFVMFGGRAYIWVQAVLLFSATLFVWSRLHTGASHEKRKEASPIL